MIKQCFPSQFNELISHSASHVIKDDVLYVACTTWFMLLWDIGNAFISVLLIIIILFLACLYVYVCYADHIVGE